MYNDSKKRLQNTRNILKQAEVKISKLHNTDKEMSTAITVFFLIFH